MERIPDAEVSNLRKSFVALSKEITEVLEAFQTLDVEEEDEKHLIKISESIYHACERIDAAEYAAAPELLKQFLREYSLILAQLTGEAHDIARRYLQKKRPQ